MNRPDLIDKFKDTTLNFSAFSFSNKEVLELIRYIEYLEAQDRRRDWPTDLHEQYLVVLDERDALQERVDELTKMFLSKERIIEELRKTKAIECENVPKRSGGLIFGDNCEHEWDVVGINYGYGDHTIKMCVLCGAQKSD